jgi:hypothetical protein
MSTLGIANTPQAALAEKKSRRDKLIVVGLGLVIAFFSWVTISNGCMLIFGSR